MKLGGVVVDDVVENIFVTDKKISCVLLVDSDGRIIKEKFKPQIRESLCIAISEYVLDLRITKRMLDVFDDSFGHSISLMIKRKKSQQIIIYHELKILYVICEEDTPDNKMSEILGKINEVMKIMNEENRNPDLSDATLGNSCPNCNGKLMSVSRHDGLELPEQTKMIIYCVNCEYEQNIEDFKKELGLKCK